MKHFAILLGLMTLVFTTRAAYVPVALSGFNKDLIANGTGPAINSVSGGFDNANYAFVAQDFGGGPTYFLPTSGTLTSVTTPGLTYQLASYSANNTLHLTNSVAQTLTFNSPQAAKDVFVLGTTGSGTATTNIVVNFSDNSSQTFTGIFFDDWFFQPGAVNGVGRVNITNDQLEGNADDPSFYEKRLTIGGANQFKSIVSITVNITSGSGFLGIFAVSIDPSAPAENPTGAPPIANFEYRQGIDTVWINSPHVFTNTSSFALRSYWWSSYLGPATKCKPGIGCFHDTTNYNFRTQFDQRGYYVVKLVVNNGLSDWDSVTKIIYVDTPTRKPVADFYFDKLVFGQNDRVKASDVSHYGPTGWQWSFDPPCYNCTDTSQRPNIFERAVGDSGNNVPLPLFYARETGMYNICLKVWNVRGVDSVCKPSYIEVKHGATMCSGLGNVDGNMEGYLFDQGGSEKYSAQAVAQCTGGYLIDPCATKITLNIEQFRLRTTDKLFIYDGKGTDGVLLAQLTGANLPSNQRTFIANSGRMYLTMTTGAAPNITDGDSGFVMRWTSVPATYPAPTASFLSPDTVYSGYTVTFANNSTASGNVTYSWDADGDGIFETTTLNATTTFTSSSIITKDIKLRVTNCKGTAEYVKTIWIIPVVVKPEVNFDALNTEGFTSDVFYLFNRCRNGANQFKWSFVPNDVIYLSGTNENSENPVFRLPSTGRYTVKLVAANSSGTDSLEKSSYLYILSYSAPYTDIFAAPTTDVGISRVTMANIDKTSALIDPVYQDFSATNVAVLYRGVTYNINAFRNTTNTPMTRKIWIDKNLDADFFDPGELIASETNTRTLSLSGEFTLPNSIAVGRVTRLRVGITTGSSELTPDKAKAGCFEDYSIIVAEDTDKPFLFLKGSSNYRSELNKPYVEPGYIAFDAIEGDISDRVQLVEGSVNVNQVGYYTLKYIVFDLYGNASDTAERIVQVELNQTGPVITLNGPDTVYVEVNDGYTEAGATAADNTGNNITNKLRVTNTVNTSTIGEYGVTYVVTDAFNFTTVKKRVVYVRDTQAPVITTTYGGHFIKHQVGTPFMDEQIIVSDNYYHLNQITVTRTGVVNVNVPQQYNLSYVAEDPSGNISATYFVWVDVRDTIRPEVLLKGDNPLLLDVFEPIVDPGVAATDNFYNVVTVIPSNNININVLGTYEMTYIVRDPAGNETIVKREVKVVDREAPRLELLGPESLKIPRWSVFEDPGIKIKDNYQTQEELESHIEISTNFELNSAGEFFANLGGWKYITYVVTDASGNKSKAVTRYIEAREDLVPTGIGEYGEADKLMVYPNPAGDVLKVRFKEDIATSATVIVYNMLGEEVMKITKTALSSTEEITLNTSELKDGIYMLKLEYGDKQATKRVLIGR